MPAFFLFKARCATSDTGTEYRAPILAMETDTPGILLTEADSNKGCYRLTHRQSGMCITGGKLGATRDVFGLLETAKALGKVTNWRRHAKNICTKKIGAATREVLKAATFEWEEMKESAAVRQASRRAIGLE